ncbi:MAG: ABC transporter substrate-binding protein [Theionarchaea archaeon]|nr:ABC transporter substrate-binding protein [Theionarchaea archaeon]
MRKASLIMLILLLLSVPSIQSDSYGGTLKMGFTTPIETLDPHRINIFYDDFDSSIAVVSQIFEGLVSYAEGTAEIQPLLAESWDISDDGLVYTFHLRGGVFWQDGNDIFPEGESREVTSEDFCFAWDRVMTPRILSPMREFFEKTAKIQSWKANGRKIFEVTLSQPNPAFLYVLPFPCFSVVPREIDEMYGMDMFSAHTVGTGPFQLKTWSDALVLSYNEDYWGGEPYLSEITYTIHSSQDLASAFENTSIDVCIIPAEVWDTFDQDRIVTVPRLEIVYIGMNCQKPPLTDPRVRQALNFTLDPEDSIAKIHGKKAVEAVSLLPPGLVCSRETIPEHDRYARNIDKARLLLEEAGYTSHPRFTLQLLSFESHVQQQFNEIYREQLREIDVELEIEYVDFGSLLSRVDKGETQLFTLGWYVDWPYPDQFLLLFHSSNWGPGGNGSFYMNKEVDSLLKEAGSATDIQVACQLYQQAEEKILEDAPWILQWHRTEGYAVQEWVNEFSPGGMGDKYLQLKSVWISSDHRQTTRIPPEPKPGGRNMFPFIIGGGILTVIVILIITILRKKMR